MFKAYWGLKCGLSGNLALYPVTVQSGHNGKPPWRRRRGVPVGKTC
ncbi:MAG: hypothetical protein WA118_01755 [Carboxydocellales bacterium]